jgi:hypothetical protein
MIRKKSVLVQYRSNSPSPPPNFNPRYFIGSSDSELGDVEVRPYIGIQ